jgi:hypothetical protein
VRKGENEKMRKQEKENWRKGEKEKEEMEKWEMGNGKSKNGEMKWRKKSIQCAPAGRMRKLGTARIFHPHLTTGDLGCFKVGAIRPSGLAISSTLPLHI